MRTAQPRKCLLPYYKPKPASAAARKNKIQNMKALPKLLKTLSEEETRLSEKRRHEQLQAIKEFSTIQTLERRDLA